MTISKIGNEKSEVVSLEMYEYMVVYNFPNGNGRIEIKRDRPIQSYDDVVGLDKFISKSNNIKNLYVADFKLLRICKE